MRSDIIHSLAAVLAVLTQFAAVFAVFALPVAATPDRRVDAMTTGAAAHEQSGRQIAEVIVRARRAI
jgi:hypothetical protein